MDVEATEGRFLKPKRAVAWLILGRAFVRTRRYAGVRCCNQMSLPGLLCIGIRSGGGSSKGQECKSTDVRGCLCSEITWAASGMLPGRLRL